MDTIAAAGAVLGALATVVTGSVKGAAAWRKWRLRRRFGALYAACPPGPADGLDLVKREDVEAARWGEERGLVWISQSFDGISMHRR